MRCFYIPRHFLDSYLSRQIFSLMGENYLKQRETALNLNGRKGEEHWRLCNSRLDVTRSDVYDSDFGQKKQLSPLLFRFNYLVSLLILNWPLDQSPEFDLLRHYHYYAFLMKWILSILKGSVCVCVFMCMPTCPHVCFVWQCTCGLKRLVFRNPFSPSAILIRTMEFAFLKLWSRETLPLFCVLQL